MAYHALDQTLSALVALRAISASRLLQFGSYSLGDASFQYAHSDPACWPAACAAQGGLPGPLLRARMSCDHAGDAGESRWYWLPGYHILVMKRLSARSLVEPSGHVGLQAIVRSRSITKWGVYPGLLGSLRLAVTSTMEALFRSPGATSLANGGRVRHPATPRDPVGERTLPRYLTFDARPPRDISIDCYGGIGGAAASYAPCTHGSRFL